jgi:hypothetical protein
VHENPTAVAASLNNPVRGLCRMSSAQQRDASLFRKLREEWIKNQISDFKNLPCETVSDAPPARQFRFHGREVLQLAQLLR